MAPARDSSRLRDYWHRLFNHSFDACCGPRLLLQMSRLTNRRAPPHVRRRTALWSRARDERASTVPDRSNNPAPCVSRQRGRACPPIHQQPPRWGRFLVGHACSWEYTLHCPENCASPLAKSTRWKRISASVIALSSEPRARKCFSQQDLRRPDSHSSPCASLAAFAASNLIHSH